jgi:hypothetical protein
MALSTTCRSGAFYPFFIPGFFIDFFMAGNAIAMHGVFKHSDIFSILFAFF